MQRKYFVAPRIPQQLEHLIKSDKKWDERQLYIGQEWILEIYLKLRGVYVPAFDLRFQEQGGENADADKHDHYL